MANRIVAAAVLAAAGARENAEVERYLTGSSGADGRGTSGRASAATR